MQVLLEALRGLDARAVVVGFGDYRARARGARAARARSSRARSSTAISFTSCRSPTSRSCRRSFRRRSAWSPRRLPLPACRRSSRPLGSRRGGRRHRRRVPARSPAHLTSFPTGDAARAPRAPSRAARPAAGERAALGLRRAARRRANWSWARVARAAARAARARLGLRRWATSRSIGYEELLAASKAGVRGRSRLHGRGRGGVRAPRSVDARAR